MFSRVLSVATVILGAIFLFCIAAFKVIDSDFWWHIKAGELLWQTKEMIDTDPFAYTRQGMPYIATHEWLAQIFLYGIFKNFGAAGIAVLRWISMLTIAALLLSLDWRRVWPNVFLIATGFVVVRQGLIERPQLFTNIFFALTCIASLRLLDAGTHRSTWMRWGITLVIAQILWVNMHGGAAFLALLAPAAVFVAMLVDRKPGRDLLLSILLGIALLLVMLISPNDIHNLTYVWLLFTDDTAAFIKEWSPHPWGMYLVSFGMFWVVAMMAIFMTGRDARSRISTMVGPLLIVLLPGILSRTGSRHEILFVIAALAVTIYQLSKNDRWKEFLSAQLAQKWHAIGITIFLIGVIIGIDTPYRSFLAVTNRQGFGTEEMAREAFDFVSDNGIEGPMFNTYSLGGYLLYRGSPQRKVFIDGRNVDYGYDFLKAALDARYDRGIFDELAMQYGFTHAIIEYNAGKQSEGPLDFDFLNTHPDWSLVFIDDSVAVYLRRTAANQRMIESHAYQLLTPEGLLRQSALSHIQSAAPQLMNELVRAAKDTEEGISALVLLSLAQSATNQFNNAVSLAQEAMRRRPTRYEPYLAGAIAFKGMGKEEESKMMYEEARKRARKMEVQLRERQ